LMRYLFYDGCFYEEDRPVVTCSDRAFLFGDAIFTTMLVEDGVPCYPARHLKRLYEQCHNLGICVPFLNEGAIAELINRNKALAGSYRLKVFVSGGSDKALALPKRKGRVMMSIAPFKKRTAALRVCLFPEALGSPISRFKSASYLERLYLKQYALDRGCDECVTLSKEGFLLEGAFSNIYWLIDDTLYTPDPKLPFLQGVMLDVIKDGWEGKVENALMRLEDLPPEASLFFCNSLNGALAAHFVETR